MEDAFEKAGCPACSVLRRVEERSIFFFLYEGMTDPTERRRFVEGGGFCPCHFRIVAGLKEKFAIGNFEIVALFGSLLQDLSEGIDWSVDKPAITLNGKKKSKSAGGCIFCSETSEREIGLLMAIEQLLDDDEFKQQMGEHPLCWRHSLIAGNSWRDVFKRAWLLEKAGNWAASMSRHLGALLAEQDNLDKTVLRATVAKAIQFLAGTPC
jgi:hypothetical protein